MKLFAFAFAISHFLACFFVSTGLSAQPAFRDGYIITKYGDTIRGRIKNSSAEEITFRDSRKQERVFNSGELKEFGRCGFVYVSTRVPGDSAPLFIVRILQGKIDLYATIMPENTSDAAVGGALVGGLFGGFLGALAGGAIGSAAAGVPDSICKEQYYSIGRFYLKNGDDSPLLRVPNGRKKFNDFMIPLMLDHIEVVRDTPETLFYAGNTIAIVRQYNAAAGK